MLPTKTVMKSGKNNVGKRHPGTVHVVLSVITFSFFALLMLGSMITFMWQIPEMWRQHYHFGAVLATLFLPVGAFVSWQCFRDLGNWLSGRIPGSRAEHFEDGKLKPEYQKMADDLAKAEDEDD